MGSKNFGEAGKYYSIFTRDLGLVLARADGVRKLSSKLRFVLQDFAYLQIDLVAGRDIFRVTNALKTGRLEQVAKQPETFGVFKNIAVLLKRLLTGVEPNQALFADLLNGLFILEKVETKEGLHSIEAVIVLRILHNLGYIGGSKMLENLARSPFEENLIFEVSKSRIQVLRHINKALRGTQL